MLPTFDFCTQKKVNRYGTTEDYNLVPAKDVPLLESHFQSIKDCCNEEYIYQWLFKDITPNGYQLKHAKEFLEFTKKSWLEKKQFTFFLLTTDHKIVGTMTIKNNDLEAGEIGYWISQDHRGLATNSLLIIKEYAKTAGFKSLFAQTKTNNKKSEAVLKRSGFTQDQSFVRDKKCQQAFICKL